MTKYDSVNEKSEFLCYVSVDMPPIVITARSRGEILKKYPRLLVMTSNETIEKYDPREPPLGLGIDPEELNLNRLENVRKSFVYRYDIDEDPRDGLAIQYGTARNMESFMCGIKDSRGHEKYFQIWSTAAGEIRKSFPEVAIIPPRYGLTPPNDPFWRARHFVVDFPEPIKKVLEGDDLR